MFKKTTFLFLTVAVLLTLSSCKSMVNTTKPSLDEQFISSFTIIANDTEISGNISRLGLGIYEMEIISPEDLAGLTVSYSDSGILCKFNGLELNLAKDEINNYAYFEMIFSALDNYLTATDAEIITEERGLVYKNTINSGEFELCFDTETQKLTQIFFLTKNIVVNFENFVE